jgi:hypothetical protein
MRMDVSFASTASSRCRVMHIFCTLVHEAWGTHEDYFSWTRTSWLSRPIVTGWVDSSNTSLAVPCGTPPHMLYPLCWCHPITAACTLSTCLRLVGTRRCIPPCPPKRTCRPLGGPLTHSAVSLLVLQTLLQPYAMHLPGFRSTWRRSKTQSSDLQSATVQLQSST